MAGIDFPKRPNTSSFLFASTFQGENALRTGEWVLSEDSKYEGQDTRVRVEPCNLEGGVFAGDYGLLLDESHKHYAVGASFPKPINNAGKDLVVQYEVQVRDGANCGGAYVKLLREARGGEEDKEMETETEMGIMKALNNDSPYSVMFGPDKCFRDTNKVHFIFQHQNPKTKGWEEKHFKDAPKIKDDGGFHVYTLHIKTDNTFDLYIDTEVVSSGSLLEDMKPPLVPPEEIDDPEDKQPDDWVTEAKIQDPDAVKPDDWDEDAPRKIVDEDAVMPEGWLEDAEEIIPDPSATKPDDWDDEADGEWEPVMIANPACREGPGCGKWEKPLIPNPAYKGKWSAPMIANPEYVGKWKPAKIPNPAYFDVRDTQPSDMAPIIGLAVEIWTVDGGIWLDNFVVGEDISAALELAESTWRHKFDAYEAVAAAERRRKEAETAKTNTDNIASKIESASRSLESASRSLVDKARPLLPDAASPTLDMVDENPIAAIATILAGILALVLLFTLKGGRQGRGPRSKKSAKTPTSAPAPAADNTASATSAEGSDEPDQQEEEEDATKDDEDDEDGADKGASAADSDASAPISST